MYQLRTNSIILELISSNKDIELANDQVNNIDKNNNLKKFNTRKNRI